MPYANPLLAAVEPPPIPAAHAWAARYDGRLGPLMDFCQAVPGYAPHPGLLDHAATAAQDPAHAKYGLIPGDLALRLAYAAELSALYGGAITPDQVAITAGCNQAFFLAMLTLATHGDNILLPVPWFWNHQQTCTMLGLEPRPLPCDPANAFVPDPDDAARLIDSRTRAIVLISPNNPTGAVYPPDLIARFHALCTERGITLVLDETYRDFLPQGQARAHELFTSPTWPAHLVQLYSFSKSFCVPGHRLGAVTADAALVQQFVKALDCLHICPSRPAQAAMTWGLANLATWRDGNRTTINHRAEAMRAALQQSPDWRIDSLGAYFAYVRHPFPGRSAAAVTERLAAEAGAVGLPGSAFGPGQERHIRLAFANVTADQLAALTERIAVL